MTKPLYAHLSTGKRAGLTSLWNRYHSLAEVSRASGVTEDVIVAYLKTRDGYPGSITGARPPVGRRLHPKPRVKDPHLVREHAAPITLPRVSCLGRE